MRGEYIRTRLSKCVDIGINWGNHQVNIHDALDMWPDGGTGGRPKCDVRNEMSVHHINMYPICALCLDGGTFCAKICEIGGKG